MSFLDGIFLFALPIVALPIVLHLLWRKQSQVILWGAMQFLTEAVNKGRRFSRIDEWLLLVLRVAALLLLVLALARPLVSGLTPEPSADREVVLVLDDSLSTERKHDGSTVFDQLLEKASEFIEARPAGESVRIMLAAEGPRWLIQRPILATSSGKKQLLSALEGLHPTQGAADFLSCLRLASSFDSPPGDEEKKSRSVVIFTDGQAHGWQIERREVWQRLRTVVDQSSRQVSFELVSLDSPVSTEANLCMDRVKSSRQIVGVDEMVLFTAVVTNTGATKSHQSMVVWSVDAKSESESVLPPLEPGQSRTVEWKSALGKPGVHDIAAKIEFSTVHAEDLLTLDNSSGVVIEVVASLPILILAETAELNTVENMFLSAALGHGEDEQAGVESWHSLYAPTFVKASDAERENLAKYNAIILNGLNELSTVMVENLEDYVRGGGGLWAMLGSRIEREHFDRHWYRDGAGLAPLPLGNLLRPTDPNGAEATIHPPAGDHPTTAMLADTTRLDIDKVRLHRYYTLAQQSGQELTPLLASGRGEPIALRHNLGKGRVILQTFPLEPHWSDLAISKSFVVLVQDWLTYLTEPAATRFNLSSREPFTYRLPEDSERDRAEVTLPDGEKRRLLTANREGLLAIRFPHTNLPGRYELVLTSNENDRRFPFRVARDADESHLAALDRADIAKLGEFASIRVNGSSPTVVATSTTRLPREPAWWPLLIAMLCLMVAESLLATRVSRGRFWEGVVATT